MVGEDDEALLGAVIGSERLERHEYLLYSTMEAGRVVFGASASSIGFVRHHI
jgi:hypothetical protein